VKDVHAELLLVSSLSLFGLCRAPRQARVLPVLAHVLWLVSVMLVKGPDMSTGTFAFIGFAALALIALLLPRSTQQRMVYARWMTGLRVVFLLNAILIGFVTFTVAFGRQSRLMSGNEADDIVVQWLHSSAHPLATWTYLALSIICFCTINALRQTNRIYRVLPVVVRSACLIYVHNVRESGYLMEAVGTPIGTGLYISHWVMATIYLSTLLLSNPVKI
jgi:hypothetical protein